MPKSLIAAVAALAAGFISSSHANESAIQAHCQSEWAGDSMRAVCVEEQRKAAEAIVAYSGPTRDKCERRWKSDFEMILHCIEKESASQGAIPKAPRD